MSQSLTIHSPPPCPHLHRGYCLEASRLLGMEIRAGGSVCNVSCAGPWAGPYCGREISDEARGSWAAKMFRYACGKLINKIRARYSKPIEVWIPDEVAAEVREAFAPLIREHEWIRSIGLTGSILSREHKAAAKDLDIVLTVDDLRHFIDAKRDHRFAAPAEIASLPVDLFIHPEGGGSFFMVLDLLSDPPILTTCAPYNVVAVDPRIRVEHNAKAEPVYLAFIDSLPLPVAEDEPRAIPPRAERMVIHPAAVVVDAAGKPINRAMPGPGSLVRRILRSLGFTYDAGNVLHCPSGETVHKCGCAAFAELMNQWGYLGCLRRRREIRGWFTVKASQCGIKMDATYRSLLGRAIREALRAYFTRAAAPDPPSDGPMPPKLDPSPPLPPPP